MLLACLVAAPGLSASEIAVYDVSGSINASPGETAAAVIKIDIPDKNYIYANPKGKGIGKATEVSIEESRFIESSETRYPAGTVYRAQGDPDTVFIYKKSVRIPVAFTLAGSVPYGKYSLRVKVSALACSSDSCIPFEKTLELPVSVVKTPGAETQAMKKNMAEFLSLKKNESAAAINIQQRVNDKASLSDSFIPDSIVFRPSYPHGEIKEILEAILFGLIAGFLLNFMPCVLPVVSLKVMSFVMNAGEKKGVIAAQGAVFSGGILASFLLLAALASFFGYQWGGLFQSSGFIIVMAAFIFAMALSLLGVFTLNAPSFAGTAVSKKHGIYIDAFIKGAVATLLATPCSGPFLGGTVAWALAMPPYIIFAVFMSIGAGMALPYLVLSFNPSLVRFVPKPGAWMNYFETAMGFLLMFTVVYLIHISGGSGAAIVLFLLFISIGLWQFGKFGSAAESRGQRLLSASALVIIIAAGYILSFNYLFVEKKFPHERYSFSAERLLSNRDRNVISVVEFTADWCPNCSLVEKIALEKPEVQKLFARGDVEFIVADITEKNPSAESLMQRLGSRSIPLLAVFPPGEGFTSPLCLRDIYSADDVLRSIAGAEKFLTK